MSGQSDVLLETNAYYIPNDVCRTFVGSFRDTAVDFEDVVTTATLCATDFENLTDSCRGDSGGGLIIKGETAQDDLLVGLVSQGYVLCSEYSHGTGFKDVPKCRLPTLCLFCTNSYGCANPTLPALYARVSEVDSWIRDMVCEYSENPPLDFGCSHTDDTSDDDDDDDDRSLAFPCEGLPVGRDTDGSTNTSGSSSTSTLQGVQNTPCTGLLPFTNITVKLRLDTRPEQRGWVLRGKDEKGIWRTVAERPILHYSGIEPLSTVLDVVSVRNNREYEIVLLDSYGDGQDFELASSMVLEIRDLNDQVLLSIDDFSGLDLYHSTFGFAVGVPATFAPTQSMTPSVTMTPTSSPTAIRPFISVVIQFGSIPQDIGFRLEIFEDSAETELFEGQNTEEYTLLHVVYPGNFAADLEASRIMLEIPLKPESSQKQTYQFTMISNEGLGVLSGGYEVWLGPALTGDFLFRGGDFSYEDAHTFFIDPKMPASEIPVPSPATAADAPILTSPMISPDEAVGDHSVTPSSSSASSACFSTCSYLLVACLPFLVQ
jgi:Trypsin